MSLGSQTVSFTYRGVLIEATLAFAGAVRIIPEGSRVCERMRICAPVPSPTRSANWGAVGLVVIAGVIAAAAVARAARSCGASLPARDEMTMAVAGVMALWRVRLAVA